MPTKILAPVMRPEGPAPKPKLKANGAVHLTEVTHDRPVSKKSPAIQIGV